MSEICTSCGLPKEICVCETIAKEKQKIRIRVTKRRYGKLVTIIEGIDNKEINIKKLSKDLKSGLACGGTAKGGIIELQGDHKEKAKKVMLKLGFPENTIDAG